MTAIHTVGQALTIVELAERSDQKARLLAVLLAMATNLQHHYAIPQPRHVDRHFKDADTDYYDIEAKRLAEQAQDEPWWRPMVSDPDTFKTFFWLIERWQFVYRQGGRMLTDSKNVARSWEYFLKIVVPARAGVWQEYCADGQVRHILDTRPGDLSQQELQELDKFKRAEERDRHRAAKVFEKDEQDKMRERGFPYAPSFDEYVRFLQNNFEAVNFASIRVTLEDILSIFIKAPFDDGIFRRGHSYIVGRSGSGKSEFLKGIAYKLERRFVVIDPHGDLADELSKSQRLPGAKRIAPHEARFVINPFDITDKSQANRELVAQEITDLITELVEDSGLSRLMTTVIFPIVYTLLKLPYSDFKMLTDCINPNTGRALLKGLRSHVESHHASIWRELEGDTYDTSKQSVYNRLQSLLNYRIVMQTLCGRDDFGDVIKEVEEGRVAIVSLPIPALGETVSVTIGRFFMTRMQIWAKGRQSIPAKDRTPVCLIVDEFHNFMSHATAQTLDQFGRKFGLFMILAHQHIQQITDREIKGSILANTVNKFAGMSNAETRQALSKEMTIEASELEDLKPGHFVARLGNDAPFSFYARMIRPKSWGRQREPYTSKNGPEVVDGWDGLDVEQSTPAAPGKTPKPKKGMKPKFDL